MRTRKTEVRFFDITEHEKEQEYLRRRNQEGWRFVHVYMPGIYLFEGCEPEDVVYQLDYNKDGTAHKDEYVQMFEDCGWEYLMDSMGYTYFRKPVSEMRQEEEIFCDDQSRLDMIERVFKGRMIPLLAVFFCILLPQLFIQASIDYTINHFLFVLNVVMLIMYLSIFIKFAINYWRLKKSVK